MIVVLSLLWGLFVVLNIIRWYRRDGILFFLDFNRIAILIWSLGSCLYNLALSELLHPSISINAACALIVAIFMVFEAFTKKDVDGLKTIIDGIRLPNNVIYWVLFTAVAILCFISFSRNAGAGNLRALSDNPGASVSFEGGYFLRLSVPIAIASFYVFRLAKSGFAKGLGIVLFLVYAYITASDLSRGPVLWMLTGLAILELFNYCRRTGKIRANMNSIIIIVLVAIIVLMSFDYFGSIRTANHFSSLNAHYQMKVDMPSGLTWVYIYITTPLENARFALENLHAFIPTAGANLIYPIVKFGANIVGLDEEFVHWLSSASTIYPYLADGIGLTVGSFILDALQDFSYLGLFVYPIAFGVVSLVSKRMLSSSIISNYTKLIIYSLIIQEPLWSIFDNMVVSGPIWVCIAVFALIDVGTTFFTRRRYGSVYGERVSKVWIGGSDR